MKYFKLLSIFSLVFLLYHCQPTRNSGQQTVPENPRERADYYLSKNMYQEAAWEYFKIDEDRKARELLEELETFMESENEVAEEMPIGQSRPNLVKFDHGIQGIFKAAEWIAEGNVAREVAAFRLDTLLGFYLTPLTILREIDLPDSSRKRGSVQYFIRNSKTAIFAGGEETRTDTLRLFDAILGNNDRHLGNWLIRETGEIVAIDHNRTFEYDSTDVTFWENEIRNIEDPQSIREIYEKYKQMPEARFKATMGDFLEPENYELFLGAREQIIKKMDTIFKNN